MVKYNSYADLKIGTFTSGLTSVIDLSYGGSSAKLPPPKVTFQEAASFDDLATGGIKRLGPPIVRWIWDDGVDYTGWQALRSFVTTAAQYTSPIYIQSPDQMGDLRKWSTVMRWPDRGLAYQSFEYLAPFVIEFVRCEEFFDWWDPNGVGLSALAAYRAINSDNTPWLGGPASYDDTLLDLTGNGYDLIEGNGAVPWLQTAGWQFSAAAQQYFDTGLVPANDQSWSMFVEYANCPSTTGDDHWAGAFSASGIFAVYGDSAAPERKYANGLGVTIAAHSAAGNIAVAGNQGYWNGSAEGGTLGAWPGSSVYSVFIGARNTGAPVAYISSDIAAVIFYDEDPADVQAQASAIDAAMGEL